MFSISCLTPIDLAKNRNSSCSEKALSFVSNCFYLGGKKIEVYSKTHARLSHGKVHWLNIALKIVCYTVFFPLTFVLLTVNYCLRKRHKYTIVEGHKKPIETASQLPIESSKVSSGEPDKKGKRPPINSEISTDLPFPPACEGQFNAVIIQVFYGSHDNSIHIKSDEDIDAVARNLVEKIHNMHGRYRIQIPLSAAALKFYTLISESLQITPIEGVQNEYLLQPKSTQHCHDNLTVYTYSNGVIEQVESSEISPKGEHIWSGSRFYPNGIIEKGSFCDFEWKSGKRIENKFGIENISYRKPAFVIKRSDLGIGIIKDKDTNELIAVKKNVETGNYVKDKLELIPTLAMMMDSFEAKFIEKINSQFLLNQFPELIEDTIIHIFDNNLHFRYQKNILIAILEVIRDKNIKVDFRKYNNNKEDTLLSLHFKNDKIRNLILSIDPSINNELEGTKCIAYKNEVKFFDTYYFCPFTFDFIQSFPEDIVNKIFNNPPKEVSLEEIVESIFSAKYADNVSLMLKALQLKFPQLELTPFDKIRKALADEFLISNQRFNELLKEYKLENDQEKINICHDLAYRWNRPYIYRESQPSVRNDEYTLNFLWVNLDPQDRCGNNAQNIFNDGLDLSENADVVDQPALDYLKESLTNRLSIWAKANPGAKINLWYDSALVTENARIMTLAKLGKISDKIKLKDVRCLPRVLADKDITNALHPASPVYFRVDLIKTLVADHMMNKAGESAKYCVISDFDVKPMSKGHLFDQRTVDYLNDTGFVFAKNSSRFNFNFDLDLMMLNKNIDRIKNTFFKDIISNFKITMYRSRNKPLNNNNSKTKDKLNFDSNYLYLIYKNLLTSFQDEASSQKFDSERITRKPVLAPCHSASIELTSELCRFVGDEDAPYILNGRGGRVSHTQILKDWKAEPLPPLVK